MALRIVSLIIVLGGTLYFAAGGEAQSVEEVVDRVLTDGKWAGKQDLEFLGEAKSEEAFAGLCKYIKAVDDSWSINDGFWALRHFVGVPFERDVIEYLVKQTKDANSDRREDAAHRLISFQASAQAELRGVVTSNHDPLCRAWALQGILNQLRGEATPEALAIVLENTILDKTAYRPRLRYILDGFPGPRNLEVFTRLMRKKTISPFVKSVAVESLAGRAGEGVDWALKAALKEKSQIVAYAAVIGVLERDPALFEGELKRLTKSKDGTVRRAALVAWGRLRIDDEDWLGNLKREAGQKDPIRRQAAAVSLGNLPLAEATAILTELLQDEDRSVSAEALLALEHQREKSAIPVLIEHLAAATGQVRFDTARALERITGKQHGVIASRWQKWWADEGEAFTVPSLGFIVAADRVREMQKAKGESQATFYGLPVVSERIGFVLDLSGSMDEKAKGAGLERVTRKEMAETELFGVLDKLPDGVLLQLIFFGTEIAGWREEPVPLDAAARADLRKFVAQSEPRGSTAIYEALRLALSDPTLDTLYVLTDGHPSGGLTDDEETIVTEVQRWNSTRHVVIHGVSVDGKSKFLESLAEATGGSFIIAE